MQTKFDISVVIPNYNRAELLVNAINSTLNQTYPVLEILICDDGSTDNSKEKVLELNNEKIKWSFFAHFSNLPKLIFISK